MLFVNKAGVGIFAIPAPRKLQARDPQKPPITPLLAIIFILHPR
jgi:hypothetical protein